MSLTHVWILEIGILNASGNKIMRWQPWSVHMTKIEAKRERDKSIGGKLKISRKFILATQKIHKANITPTKKEPHGT